MSVTEVQPSYVTTEAPDSPFRIDDTIQTSGNFSPSKDIEYLADVLIGHHTSQLGFLEDARITYLWKHQGGLKGGKPRLSNLSKASGLVAFYTESDYVLWLAHDHVIEGEFTQGQVEALLFHTLMHADYEENEETGEIRYTMRQPEFSGFLAELDLYGAWSTDLEKAARQLKQLKLF